MRHDLVATRQAAYADNTQSAHFRHWKTYAKFCIYFDLQMAPADAETVSLFAQFLARSFKAPQSIMNYVASVKLWHTLLDFDISLFSSIEFKLTKRGLFRIMQHTVRQASPITPEILMSFRQKLNLSNPTDATFWALFLIAFFTMARKSNLVPDSVDKFDPEKQLSREKVLIGNGCLLVVWTWAKKHPEQGQDSQSSYHTYPR